MAQKGNIQTKGQRKLLSPKLDVVFQALFGEVGSERITKKFLEAILDKKLEEVDLSRNIVLRRENPKDKMGILDVLVKIIQKEYCNVEMQMVEKDNLIERILYYWSRIYGKNLNGSDDYVELKRTIGVLIVNFEIKKLKELGYHSKWKIIEEKERKLILTEHLELHIIEIPKIYKIEENEEKEELVKWINFIENPESEKVGEYMKENEEMKEAKEKLEVMSEDEKMQILAELRLKAIRDEKAIKRFAIKEGLEQGIKQGIKQGMQRGIKQGIQQGMQQGIKQGMQQGMQQGKKEIAKKMKEEGLNIELIKKVTGLTEEEINSL